MQNLNSDQLRRLLKKHTRKMNWLAEQNDLIVATLKQRGLQAVDPAGDDISIHPCIMQLDKLQSEPKPLTIDELKAGGWWCGDNSKQSCQLLADFTNFGITDVFHDIGGSKELVLINTKNVINHNSECSQIHRIGNNFYWGAPSDQAN